MSAEAARQDLTLPLELEHPEIQAGNYPQLKDTSYTPRSSYTDRRGDRNGKGEQHNAFVREIQGHFESYNAIYFVPQQPHQQSSSQY
jgi:hypothetical protein